MLWEVGHLRASNPGGPGGAKSFGTKVFTSVDTDGDGVTDEAVINSELLAPQWAAATIERARVAWEGLLAPQQSRSAAQRAAFSGKQTNNLISDADLMVWRRQSGPRPPFPFDSEANVIAAARGDKAAWKRIAGVSLAFWEGVTDRKTPFDSTTAGGIAGYKRIDPEPGPIAIPDDLFAPPKSSSPPWLPAAVGAGAVGLVLLAAAWKRSRKGRR